MNGENQITLSYKYRLLPNKAQHKKLAEILESQRILYNAALEERIDCYRKTGKSLSYFSQCKELTELRKDEEFSSIPLNIQRATIKRLDEAYRGFFRRVKKGGKVGFPRFKGKGWWNSFGFAETCGLQFDGKRIRFKNLPGGLSVHLHRPLPEGAGVLGYTFKKDHKGWGVSFQIRTQRNVLSKTGKKIGIDVGLKSLAVLSTGEAIPNPRVAKKAEKKMRIAQRALSRCKKGSNRRAKVRQSLSVVHAKIKNNRQTYLHQVSANLVRDYDVIAMEKLNNRGLASGFLAKSVNDASWATLKQFIAYKAANAGKQLIEVNPNNTTQACSGCGVIVPKKLEDRWHDCPECGLSLDRDHNAALNILARSGAMVSQDRVVAHV